MSNEKKFLLKIIEDQNQQIQERDVQVNELRQVITQKNEELINFQYQKFYEESMEQKSRNTNIKLQEANDMIEKLQRRLILNINIK